MKIIVHFSSEQSPVILDLCSRKTPVRKSYDYRKIITFERAPVLKCFCSHENEKPAFLDSSGLKISKSSVFGELPVWTVGLTGEIRLHFQIPRAYSVEGASGINEKDGENVVESDKLRRCKRVSLWIALTLSPTVKQLS